MYIFRQACYGVRVTCCGSYCIDLTEGRDILLSRLLHFLYALHKGAPSPESGDTKTGKPQQATTPTKNESPGPTSTLSQSQLEALEKASVSTRTYALGNFSDYRTDRGAGRGGGDYFRGGLGSTMGGRGAYTGDKSVRDAAALSEVGELTKTSLSQSKKCHV